MAAVLTGRSEKIRLIKIMEVLSWSLRCGLSLSKSLFI